METLVHAMRRLREDGHTEDFTAVPGGNLRCGTCDGDHEPESMTIDEIVRFEGDSNPGDQAILIAMTCSCGISGIYTAAYGPDASANDSEALQRLAGV